MLDEFLIEFGDTSIKMIGSYKEFKLAPQLHSTSDILWVTVETRYAKWNERRQHSVRFLLFKQLQLPESHSNKAREIWKC